MYFIFYRETSYSRWRPMDHSGYKESKPALGYGLKCQIRKKWHDVKVIYVDVD